MRISKRLTALGAMFLVAIVVAGCGGSSIPSGSVASVSGNLITLKAFNHWMYVAAKNQAAQSPGSPVIVPNDPPKFAGCLKQVHEQIPTLSKTPASVLKSECSQVFQQYKNEVMAYLIEGYWHQALAYKQGIKMTDAQVQAAYEKIKKKNFPTKAKYQAYLKASGETLQDILFQVRINQLYTKLLKTKTKKITPAAISAYYAAHKSSFGTKRSANIHLIRTKTQSSAQAAYNALKSGKSWNAVAKQYAADASSKTNGGLLTNVADGQQETAVNKAMFSSKLNTLVGPIKGQFGYYVLEVLKVTPATTQSLAKATPQIKQLLTSQYQQAAASAITKAEKKAYGKDTLCVAVYSVTDCANYVAPKTTTTATTTTPAATTTTGGTGTSTTGSTSTSTTGTSTASGTSTSSSSSSATSPSPSSTTTTG